MIAWILIAAAYGAQDGGFDFTRIDRKIKSEPKYDTTPKYAMLLLGAEGKVRIWMALDSVAGNDIVYVDRDADGHLGEAGERIVAVEDKSGNAIAKIGRIEFKEEKLILEGVEIYTRIPGGGQLLLVTFRLNGKVTVTGNGEWAPTPEKASFLCTDPMGTLEFQLTSDKNLKIGDESGVTLNVGTRGWPSTFMTVDETFLDLEKDKILVTVIAKDANGKEVKERSQLKEHC